VSHAHGNEIKLKFWGLNHWILCQFGQFCISIQRVEFCMRLPVLCQIVHAEFCQPYHMV